jgi:hypothetical protein
MNWLNAQQHESKGGAKWEVKVRWHSRYSDGCRIAWRIHRRVVFSDFSAEQLEQSYMWVAHQNPKYQPPWNAMLCTGGTTASCLPPWDLSAPRDASAAHLCKMLSLYISVLFWCLAIFRYYVNILSFVDKEMHIFSGWVFWVQRVQITKGSVSYLSSPCFSTSIGGIGGPARAKRGILAVMY